MANPIGEDSWLAYLEESIRKASDLEQRVNSVELFKRAVGAEPGSMRIWLSYCNFFWSLWSNSQCNSAGWTEEEQIMGRELFSFGAALDLWQQAYEEIKCRLNDSHILWSRWISLEMDLLAKTKTSEGLRRITHLFRDRLVTPHLNWDETSQMYSSFLSDYNQAAWEDSMKDITEKAQRAKHLMAVRDPFEVKIQEATRSNDLEHQKSILLQYLEWELLQISSNEDNHGGDVDLCHGLFARALTGVCATDESVWHEYIVFLSSSCTGLQFPGRLLDALRRAVQHCPWSGRLWNRLIMCAEEAKLDFAEVESIKHAATSENQLYKYGMESMIEMYVAWCGFLKRTAMDATATDEDVDVADVGLSAALEDVEVVGQRLFGQEFQGDPKFRLERIYIQYLTEQKRDLDKARAQWNKLANIQIHADSYDFWFRYYMWEMLIFSSNPADTIPSLTPSCLRIPTLATAVLQRAATRTTVDWPEKVLEVYMQHCNDYELSSSVRKATDMVQKAEKLIAKRRVQEHFEIAPNDSTYGGDIDAGATREEVLSPPSVLKRKRDGLALAHEGEKSIKRHRNGEDAALSQSDLGRDRENTTVIITKLPQDVSQTKVRQYFKEYGHIINITALTRDENDQSTTAMIEFSSPDEANSALLKDGKFFDQSQICVRSGHDLTIYVANYPPSADESYMRKLFQDCGRILSIRWPSLKVNAHRRFCYISFSDREASSKAVQKEGLVLEGKYKLLAKFSDPSHKKNREGAIAEGREVHISGLNTSTTEVEIQGIFSKYGNLTRVNIPRSMNGKGRGFAFIDFETKDQAEKAVAELNHAKFANQILFVEISKATKVKLTANSINRQDKSVSPSLLNRDADSNGEMVHPERIKFPDSTNAAIAARTIALMGFSDTVNDARVRALVEPLGGVVKLTMQPGHGGAKIEFADSASAGRASLQLDNRMFEGRKLYVGSPDDLRHAKGERRRDRILYGTNMEKKRERTGASVSGLTPLPLIRRPVPGKPVSKRSLAFPPLKAPTEGLEGTVRHNPTDTGMPNQEKRKPILKSNSDFKAMLLGDSASNKTD